MAVPVILGVLFKLLHVPGLLGTFMLIIGLGGESIVFLLMALQPEYREWDWSRAYPELSEENAASRPRPVAASGVTQQLDRMMDNAKIGPELVQSLGDGLRNFGEKVNGISRMADTAGPAQEFSDKLRSASHSVETLNQAYQRASASVAELSGSESGMKGYHEQVNTLTKNLASLNAIYEMELQDSNAHLRSMGKFYASLNETMQNFNDSLQDSQLYKEEVAKLAKNLSSLNAIYGNMLSAMNMQRA